MLLVKCIRSHENYLNWTSLLDYRAVLLLGLFQVTAYICSPCTIEKHPAKGTKQNPTPALAPPTKHSTGLLPVSGNKEVRSSFWLASKLPNHSCGEVLQPLQETLLRRGYSPFRKGLLSQQRSNLTNEAAFDYKYPAFLCDGWTTQIDLISWDPKETQQENTTH